MKHVFPERIPTWARPGTLALMAILLAVNLVELYRREAELVPVLAGWAVLVGGCFLVDWMKQRNPIVSIDEKELVVLRSMFIPSKRWRFPVEHVKRIEIHGPKGRRSWRVFLNDSSSVEIPPLYNGWLEKPMTRFMQDVVAQKIPVVVKRPPSLFAEIRGDHE